MTDKVLYENAFLSLVERDGYIFSHETRSNGRLVAVVPFRNEGAAREYLAHVEVVPAHGAQADAYSITGGVDAGQSVEQAALAELYEEAGYRCPPERLIALGTVRPSKSADTVVFLFAVDVSRLQPEAPQGDGSTFEDGTYTRWLSYAQALESADPLLIAAIARLNAFAQ